MLTSLQGYWLCWVVPRTRSPPQRSSFQGWEQHSVSNSLSEIEALKYFTVDFLGFVFWRHLLRCKCSSVQFSRSVVSDSLRPHEPQHARAPCPSPTSRIYPNPCPLSQWCHPTISSSVIPFSSCPQSFPASGFFPMSQLFAAGGQSSRVSASTSVLPMNTQDRSPLGWTGWISLQSKGLSRVFSDTTVQKHQFFGAQSRDITFSTEVRLVNAMVFLVVMYGCESWTIKKAECRRIDANVLSDK